MNYARINTREPFGGCDCALGRTSCNCCPMPAEACSEFLSPEPDPYEHELFPAFTKWLDTHPKTAQALLLAFILLALGIGGAIDHGVF